MNAPAPPSPAPAPPPEARPPKRVAPKRRPRLVLRSIATALFRLLLTAAFVAGLVAWLLGTTSGMNAAIALANRLAPVEIEGRGSHGSLAGGFGFEELRVKVKRATVTLTAVRARIQALHAKPPRIDFAELTAATLIVDVTTDPTTPLVRDIGIPVWLAADPVTLGSLTVIVDGKSFGLQSLAGRVTAGPEGYRVEEGRLAYGPQHGTFAGELGALWPFAVRVDGQLQALVQDKAIGAAVRARGSLEEMTVDAQLSGAAQGKASAAIASFDKPEVKSLLLDLTGVDPRAWQRSAPAAELAVKANLAPDASMDRIAGSVSVVNRAPGLIDAGRIPARSATAQVAVDADGIRFDRIAARMLEGSASGDFTLAFADGSWQSQARVEGLDPSQLHSAVQPLRVDGQLQARHKAGTIAVTAELAHRGQPAASLDFDGSFSAERVTIAGARLALGDGFATAAGSIELKGAKRASLHGELQRFEPGRLVKDVDARLSGRFDVDGVLQPKPAGRLRFELTDSSAWGRPLIGRGRVDVDGEQRFDVDIDLSVRSARLAAKGGLGAPGRTLTVNVDVPSIAELLPQKRGRTVSGALKLSGTAHGDWAAPAFEVKLDGKGIRYDDHSLATVEAQASYGGGADGALRILAGLSDYRYAPQPKAALKAVTVGVEGSLGNHAIRVHATADKTQGGIVLADGGWRDGAWRGRVREATIGPPLDLRLLAPASVVVGHGIEFGPAQLALKHFRLDDVRFRANDAGMATRGNFSGLEPTRFEVPVEGGLTPVLAPTGERTPLTFRGEWDLRTAAGVLDGRVVIERSRGDLYAGRGPESGLGLIDARLEARITANHLEAITRIESGRNGGIGAQVEAWLEDSAEAGWRLARARPWLVAGAFDLPTMDWINALASDHLRATVRLGGKLAGTLRIEGTPANPAATGRLTGEDLRVAWIEQGVRLENGRLLAHLTDDLFVLDELQFSGPPRVRPEDPRAAAAAPADRSGSVSANGQLRLGDLQGVIQVAATHLPLLQRPDRWAIASGGGNIEISASHVQVNGAFAADAGFVGLARSDLPSLSSDVVVVEADQEAQGRARRVTLGFDLGIDLGPAFYLRGKGLSTRVEGVVRLRSAGRGAVTAVGSIAAVDGIYEGFGQRLNIARGRLNFQGAPENPGLDILALRTGLPVEVGVTITRTATAPLVRLHSSPPMADSEALSWLVLGRPPDQSGGDNIALVQAAASLLGGGGEGYPTRVARALGIDELTIRSGNFGIASLLPARSVAGALRSDESSAATVSGEIITLGKNVNDALKLSYEQAISGTTRFLQLNYRLSQRLSVVARGGTDNALDFVYSIAFD